MDPRLDDIITQNFAKAPTEPCMWWRGTWWSRGAIGELVMECESSLIKSGFSRGQRLGLVLPNSPIMLASCIAAWRLGGSVALVNPHLKHPPVPEYLKSVDVFGAIVSREIEGLVSVISNAGIPVASAALNDAVPAIDGRTGLPDAGQGLAALFHTAGASGDVKAVPITHLNILTLLESIIEMIPSMDEDDIILNAIPNHHSFGFVVGGIMPIAYGMPQVLVSSVVPPKTTLSAIRQAGVTIIPTLPMILGILIGGEREIAPMSKVKLVFYGGGELMPGLAERTKEVFGVSPLEGYGLTEASSVLAVTPAENAIKPGASGKILSCFDAEVRDSDGNLQPYNVAGRLWIHGAAVADGYYRTDGISAERFRDGWFDTQDIVRIDEDGYITIVSAAGDVITAGGALIYPGEIEAILKGHPEIADAAVIGIPRGAKGEYVQACVVLKEGSALRPRDIVVFVRRKLPNYKAPRSVRILPELPKNNLGKVLRKELRGG
ncbi:MAG: AMP-binding protein [Synergistaceae bacterium]|jgi:long-chain acyl-CoA synthetase|nr:AMP-binding protein [Synergistaceae bacterium]